MQELNRAGYRKAAKGKHLPMYTKKIVSPKGSFGFTTDVDLTVKGRAQREKKHGGS